jgi:hypothetical protein
MRSNFGGIFSCVGRGGSMVSRRVPSLIKSIVLAIAFLTFGAGVGAPGNDLHAEECLSAPDSPSPQGTHWRYRLDWPTQRKCWYLGAPARSLRRVAAVTATPVPFEHQEDCLSAPDSPSPQGTHWRYRLDWPTQRKCWYLGAPARSLRRAAAAVPTTPVLLGRRHAVDVPPKSVGSADAASPSSHVDTLPIDPPTSDGITGRRGRLLQQSVPEDISSPAPIGTPVLQLSTLSQSGDEVGGQVLAPTTWPDPVPAGAAVQAQNPIAIPTDIPADSASFDARLTHNAGNSMATILAILALLLAALCVVAKNGAARRGPTIVDQRKLDEQRQHDRRDGQGQRGFIDEGQLLVSALRDCGLVRNDNVPYETAFEILKRKDKLARLHQDLDRLLQSPTTA